MGEVFTTFEQAWAHFLAREQPLESFWNRLSDDASATLELWLVVPPPEVKRQALRVQGPLEGVLGLRIVPHDFLHITLPDAVVDALAERSPFELRCPRLNCFPVAVVSEVESDTLQALAAPPTFLPHLSLAYVELPIDAGIVRDTIAPLRDPGLGSFVVDELMRVRIPASKATFLQPWTVVERLSLHG